MSSIAELEIQLLHITSFHFHFRKILNPEYAIMACQIGKKCQ